LRHFKVILRRRPTVLHAPSERERVVPNALFEVGQVCYLIRARSKTWPTTSSRRSVHSAAHVRLSIPESGRRP